jgi:acetoacetyl-CoA reductase
LTSRGWSGNGIGGAAPPSIAQLQARTSMKPDVAIVTGAARGIGAAISGRLSRAGWKVVGADRAWDGSSREGFAMTVDLDITSYENVAKTIDRVESEVGQVGAVVNNAGITRDGVCHKMHPDDFRMVIEVNLGGAFNLCRALLPAMRERGFGRIINISSINGLRGQAGQVNYAAAKAGLIGLTKSIALENAAKGITANCIAPGFVDSPMTQAMRPEILQGEVARIPAGRIGQPADIAGAVAFLASDEAGFVTGQVLSVNGGQLMP